VVQGADAYREVGKAEAQIMSRSSCLWLGFLALIAIIPTLVNHWMGIPYTVSAFLGGTGLLIVVSATGGGVRK
jgi:preprotein translocase subunit SecY